MGEESINFIIGIVAVGFVLVLLAVYILFLVTQQNILKAIQPENRVMQPGQVWLQLIPLFGTVWKFFVVTRIADSISREFQSWQNDSILGYSDTQPMILVARRPTYDIGIAFCILTTCGFIPILSIFTSIAAIVCLAIYWTKLVEYKKRIEGKYLSGEMTQLP